MSKDTHVHPDSPLHVKRPTDPRSVPAGVGPASSSLFLSSSLPSPLSPPPPPSSPPLLIGLQAVQRSACLTFLPSKLPESESVQKTQQRAEAEVRIVVGRRP